MRLQKWMAASGVASRRKCEELIEAGQVCVNGNVASLGCCVEEGDRVEVCGKPVMPARRVLLAYHKPRGVVCTASDPQGRKTVMDAFADFPCRLFSVGRLDYESEGLLIMTNDGDLAYKMTHPKYELAKTYHVVSDALLTNAQLAQLQSGVALEDGVSAPARVDDPRRLENGHFALELTIHEGRNREIRRMFQALGREVLRLQRVRVGNIRLGALPVGKWRYLTEEEIRELDQTCK